MTPITPPLSIATRFHEASTKRLTDRLMMIEGTASHYRALAAYHYRSGKPATITRVLVMIDPAPTAADRFLGRNAPDARDAGSDANGHARPAAVLVESLPTLSCAMRDQAMAGRFGSWLTPKQRSALMMRELRCISRVVIDPVWRGVGLAVRLVRHALQTATTPYTEAMASMSRVHPFLSRAGMTAYPRPTRACDVRLLEALRWAGIRPTDLVRADELAAQIRAGDAQARSLIERELGRWAGVFRQKVKAGGGQDTLTVRLQLARDRLLLEPVYHLHHNEEA